MKTATVPVERRATNAAVVTQLFSPLFICAKRDGREGTVNAPS